MEKIKSGLLKFNSPNENSILNLKNGVIFCQHFSKYNDPFEFWNNIYEGIPDHEKEPERFTAALQAWGMEGCDPNDADLIAYFDECKAYQPPFKEMRDSIRIACFASQKDNMLMWSHYADGLRGFCIAFDEQAILTKEPDSYIVDVEYLTIPPVVDSFVYGISYDQDWYNQVAIGEVQARLKHSKNTDTDDGWLPIYEKHGEIAVTKMREIWNKAFAVKPLEWKYENERRLLTHTTLCNDEPISIPYSQNAIKEIILGELMEPDFRKEISSVLKEKYPDVMVKTARRARGQYSIIIS
ncbi:MAG: hypothetical protein ACI8RW_000120 [Porticoccaceae bacterium]|jgi:hypothetical protein